MFRQSVISVLLVGFILAFAGCGTEKKVPQDYAIGMFYTTEYKFKSEMHFFDHGLNEVGDLAWNYSSMAYDGFSDSFIFDRTLYLLPLGHGDKLDGGKVVAFHLDTGEKKEYDFDRVNITDYTADDKRIIVTGNLNGNGYVDSYDLATNTISRMDVDGIIPDEVRISNDRVFALCMDFHSDDKFLGEFVPEEGKYEVLFSLGTEERPSYMEEYEGKLYFAKGHVLYEYSVDDKTMVKHQLPHEKAFNLKRSGDVLYIAHTDLFEEGDSFVELFELTSGQIRKEFAIDTTIVQMEPAQNEPALYVLDYEELRKYDISGEEPRLLGSIAMMEKEDFYCGGFFLREDEGANQGDLDKPDQLDGLDGLSDEEVNRKLIEWADEQEVVPDKVN